MLGSAWNAIKGAIVEEEGSPAQAAPQAASAPGTPTTSTVGTFKPIASVNQEMVDAIRKQTFSRNTALTALITASDALSDIIPDPVMRLKAAQKTAGAGRGAKEFADAVQIHLNDVDGAEMQFAQMIDGKRKKEIGGFVSQAEAAEASVNAMNNEIQSLNQRIQQLQANIGEQTTNAGNLRSQAASAEAGLAQSEQEFKAAAEAVRTELKGHQATILSTLG